MAIDYDRFMQMPDSKVTKLMKIAEFLHKRKFDEEALTGLMVLFGGAKE